jgi:hypothetical protein
LVAQDNPEAAGFILKDQRNIRRNRQHHRRSRVRRHRRGKGAQPVRLGILGLFFSTLTLIVIVIIPSKKK